MPELKLDLPHEAMDKLRFAARLMEVSESEVVTRLIASWSEDESSSASSESDEPIAVYAIYEGHRVEGEYRPDSQVLVIRSEPWVGKRFRSASGAAKEVVRYYNPDVASANRSGFEFWRIARTGKKLGSVKH